MRRSIPVLVLASATLGWLPALAARLEYQGSALPRRQVEAMIARSLAAPGDSTRLAADLGRLVSELQAQGWLDARAAADWVGLAPGQGATVPIAAPAVGDPRQRVARELTLQLTLREGVRHRLAVLEVHVPAEDSALVAEGLALGPGSWASPAVVGRAIERALRLAADRGHPYATLGVSVFEWGQGEARVRLAGALGPAVTISGVRIEGLRGTRSSVALRALGRLQDAPYSRSTAEAGRDRLAQLGLFREVSYEGLEGEGDWSRGQLVYRVEEPRYNRFEGAVGVQGNSRPVGLARIELDNLAGTGRAAALRWESRGRGVASFGARFAEPLLLGTPLRVEAALEQHVEDTLFTRTRWGGRLRFTLSRLERVEAGYEQDRVVQAQGEVEEAQVQSTVFALERDTRDQRDPSRTSSASGAQPRRGYQVRVEAGQSFKGENLRPPGRRKARASAVEARAEWHRPFGSEPARARAGLALELAGAARFSSQRILPLFERYAVGGAASLRGHDEQAFRVDRYGLARLEWRWFLGAGDQRVALFWDHAWMATRLPWEPGGDRLEIEHRDGVGFGLRLAAPGGLVGVDYGLEPGRAPLEGKIHLQLVSSF